MTTEFTSKQTAEAFAISFDFTDYLGSETIASAVITAVEWTSLVDATTTLLDVTKQVVGSYIVYGWVRAGTSGTNYLITCRIVGSSGSIYELDAILPVIDLPTTTGSTVPTSTENISSWLSDVSRRVPGASKAEIDSTVRTVIREFCTKTLLYVRELTPINIVASISSYTLIAPIDCSIIGVERVEVNGQYVDPTSLDLLNRSPENWQDTESSQPLQYMVDAEKILRFKQIPDTAYAGGLIVWASLKPAPTVDVIPNFIFDDWYETILNGAVSALLRMPNKTWSSADGAEYYGQYYDGYLSDAKSKKYTGKAKVSIRVQSEPFSVIG